MISGAAAAGTLRTDSEEATIERRPALSRRAAVLRGATRQQGEGQVEFLPGNRIEPLIEAAETYPALEQAIAGAQDSVHMAYWTIDPEQPLHAGGLPGASGQEMSGQEKSGQVGSGQVATGQGAAEGRACWLDLIAATVERGVTVRLLIADFDPVLGRDFHEDAWGAYRRFLRIGESLDETARRRLQVVCTRHEARIGQSVRLLAQPVIRRHLKESRDLLRRVQAERGRQAALDRLADMPGLWRYIRPFGQGGFSLLPNAFPTVYPAAHHEKICVVDERLVFLGGLDIDPQRDDSQEHENAFAWHDVACLVEGPVAGAFARHFRRRWNAELDDYLSFLRRLRRSRLVEALPQPGVVEKLPDEAVPECPPAGSLEAAPLRTVSAQMKSSFSRSPRNLISEIRDAYLWMIGRAQRLIYIETQFLRSQTIVDALIERVRATEGLELIVLLPLLPENLLRFRDPNSATTKGQALQERSCEKLREALGDRVGIFTLVRAGSGRIDPEEDRDAVARNMIYVHAKTIVVDDELALIGSANLNDRSLLSDTETAVLWRDRESVRHYRERLWRHALRLDVSDWEKDHLLRWRKIANRNIDLPAGKRQGFIVPLSEQAAEAFSEGSLLVPPELV